MHTCLRVDEIVRLLACELVASEAKATAVSLACCCKDYEDPVLDELWETQEELAPLLKCFPQYYAWDKNNDSFDAFMTNQRRKKERLVSQVTESILPTLNHSI